MSECQVQPKSLRLMTVAVLLISACGSAKSPTAIEAAESTVLAHLRYPASVKFAHERVVSNSQTVVCGLVAEKDSSGKYTGWRRFYVSGDPLLARIDIREGVTRTSFKNAEPSAAVSYESFWNSVGCRNSDDEPGPMGQVASWLG